MGRRITPAKAACKHTAKEVMEEEWGEGVQNYK